LLEIARVCCDATAKVLDRGLGTDNQRGFSVKIIFVLFLALFAVAAAPFAAHAANRPDREFRECPDCPVMIGIPAGKFVMGSPPGEQGRFDSEGPQHVVTIRAFALGKYAITSEEFLTFLRVTHYQPAPCNPILHMTWQSRSDGLAYAPSPADVEPPRWPAACLDWRDAEAYIAWLNAKVRKLHLGLAKRKGPYRLPSEAEWEYAARGGTTTARWWGNAIGRDHANCNGCGSPWDNRVLAAVESFAPNPFGLYGMLGNVWEWTADCWHPNYIGAPSDGRPWKGTAEQCAKHVLRGGSWDNVPVFVRSAARSSAGLDGSAYDYSSLAGFRVARDLP
jgi:formylglycine-generating enzyme required for sulfatase activity